MTAPRHLPVLVSYGSRAARPLRTLLQSLGVKPEIPVDVFGLPNRENFFILAREE
jgi:hypothetical protein